VLHEFFVGVTISGVQIQTDSK